MEPESVHHQRSRDLIAELQDGQVVLFAGAGISLGTHGQRGLPSAEELTRDMALSADFCRAGGCWNYDVQEARCRWTTGCVSLYTEVAENYAERMGRPALLSFLRDRIDAPWLEPLRAHRAIAASPFRSSSPRTGTCCWTARSVTRVSA